MAKKKKIEPPLHIIGMYDRWKKEHPDEDYRYDEIKEFISCLTRADLFEIMEFIHSFKK